MKRILKKHQYNIIQFAILVTIHTMLSIKGLSSQHWETWFIMFLEICLLTSAYNEGKNKVKQKYNLPVDIEGGKDSKYGGIITDINKLPVGTKFFVCNGAWYGTICQDKEGKYIDIENHGISRFKGKYLLSIDQKYTHTINEDKGDK